MIKSHFFKSTMLSLLGISLAANLVHAKTIVISDVDDTLKVSHAIDLVDAAAYATDIDSRFLGMSEVLQIIKLHDPKAAITYLSRGPEFVIAETHKNFLRNGNFPAGDYIARTNLPLEQHKAIHIREILKREKPDTVIMIGDNGEQDPQTYHQIFQENIQSGIRFLPYIHIVYSKNSSVDRGTTLFPEQVGFASAVELAIDLAKNNLVSQENAQELLRTMGPILVNEPAGKAYGEMVWASFSKCTDFVWKWNSELAKYQGLKAVQVRIQKQCQR